MRTLDAPRPARVLAGVALALALPLAVAACGSQQGGGSSAGGGTTAKAATQLTIEVKESRDAEPQRFTLTCGDTGAQAGGNHPSPAQACKALEQAKEPFAPVPQDMVCTEIFGGDQTATIKGTWQDQQVDASYSRKNGCEIARWDAIAKVFPVKVGAGGPV